MTLLINNDPIDADWSQRFGFGNPRSTNGLVGVCIHTTENPIGTPAENVANYQINTETGSYHVLVDNTTNDNINSIRENTDDWMTWSAGPKGNQIALHLSFVAYSRCSRDEWLRADRMLNEGADAVAYWCRRYGFPVEKIGPADLRAGRRGIFGHADVSAAWREVDHTDPGANFPWDVFLAKVRDRLAGKTPTIGGDTVSKDVVEVRDRLRAQDAPITSMVNPKVRFAPRDLAAVQDLNGWCSLVLLKAIARKLGLEPDEIISAAIADDRARIK